MLDPTLPPSSGPIRDPWAGGEMAEPSSHSFTPPGVGPFRNNGAELDPEQLKSLAMLTPEEQWAALLVPVTTQLHAQHHPAVFSTPGGFASFPPPPPPQPADMYQQQQQFDARVKYETPFLGPTPDFGQAPLPPPPLNSDLSTQQQQQQQGSSSSATAASSGPAPKATRSCDSCSLRRVRCIRTDPALGTESECKKCRDKGILCTTARVVGRRKQQRSGKRIEEARRTFGRVGADGSLEQSGLSADPPRMTSTGEAEGDEEGAEVMDVVEVTRGTKRKASLSERSADDRLAVASLSSALTMGLLDTYFDMAHLQLPRSFHRRLRYMNPPFGATTGSMKSRSIKARQREDMMDVLQAVVIAIGARASDSPAILGRGAPKLGQLKAIGPVEEVLASRRKPKPGPPSSTMESPATASRPGEEGGFDPSEWGRKREAICRTLLERAVRVCDEKGAMRVATVESVASLMLLEILIDHGDPSGRKGRPFSLAALGHLRTLTDDADPEMLMMMGELPSFASSSTDPSLRPMPPAGLDSPSSSSPDQNDESTASSTTAAEWADPKRARSDMENLLLGGGGGWSAFVRDGFLAAGTGRALHASDEDVELFKRRYWRSRERQPRELEEVVERIWEVDSVEAAKEAEWLLWERVCRWARAHVHRLSGPMARSKTRLDLGFVPEFWAALDVISRSVQTTASHLDDAVGTDTALADQEAFLRGNCRLVSLGLCYLTFACDRTLALRRAQQEEAKQKREAQGRTGEEEAEEAEYVARLAELKASSELRCFEAARSIVAIMHRSLDGAASMGIVTGIHFMYEWLPSCVYLIVGMDDEEAGGPEGYTRAVKLTEIRHLTDILRSLSWSWSDIVPTMNHLETILDHLELADGDSCRFVEESSGPTSITDPISVPAFSTGDLARRTTGHPAAQAQQSFTAALRELAESRAASSDDLGGTLPGTPDFGAFPAGAFDDMASTISATTGWPDQAGPDRHYPPEPYAMFSTVDASPAPPALDVPAAHPSVVFQRSTTEGQGGRDAPVSSAAAGSGPGPGADGFPDQTYQMTWTPYDLADVLMQQRR